MGKQLLSLPLSILTLVFSFSVKANLIDQQKSVHTNDEFVLQHIRKIICDTKILSWFYIVSKDFGEPRTGSLKADEQHSLSTLFLPVTLVTHWGKGTS